MPGAVEICLRQSQRSRRVESSQTSSYSSVTRNRQPGGSARYGRTSGAHASRCPACNATKKLGSCENVWPAQINHPVVPSSGLILMPFSGRAPLRTPDDTPTISRMSHSKNRAFNRSHTARCRSFQYRISTQVEIQKRHQIRGASRRMPHRTVALTSQRMPGARSTAPLPPTISNDRKAGSNAPRYNGSTFEDH